MNDEAFGFGPAIKRLYPEDYDEICKFAEKVSSAAGTVRATFSENEFPQFMAKLNKYRGMGGRSELILDWESRDTLAGQVCSQVGEPKGAFYLNQWGFTLMDIGQHRFVFVSWDKDRRTTRVFWNGGCAGIFKRNTFWQNFSGGSFDLRSPDGRILVSFAFPNLLASMGSGSWSKIRVRYADEQLEVAVSNVWPAPGGGISGKFISDFSKVPFEKQIIAVAVLLWTNNSL
jgi:hypothetical protein